MPVAIDTSKLKHLKELTSWREERMKYFYHYKDYIAKTILRLDELVNKYRTIDAYNQKFGSRKDTEIEKIVWEAINNYPSSSQQGDLSKRGFRYREGSYLPRPGQ